MNFDAISRFASVLSMQERNVIALDSGFNGSAPRTKIIVDVASGPVRVSVVDDTATIRGGSDALAQIARNLLGLIRLSETKGVSHMHFDHLTDEDFIGSDSAGLIVVVRNSGDQAKSANEGSLPDRP